ncbi:MAG: hypothetical protein ABF515_10510 [Bifidobacterium sp.]
MFQLNDKNWDDTNKEAFDVYFDDYH